jgi:hypothetical protein
MVFASVPHRRTLLVRVRAWRSTRRSGRHAMTIGVEHHQRMVRALRAASTEVADPDRG